MPNLVQRIKQALLILAGYHLQEWTPDRQYRVDHSSDAKRDIPYGVRSRMVDWAREMERKDPLYSRFLDLCEQYVIGTGIRIISASSDRKWASAADAEWEDWQPWCDIASRQGFGQRQSLIERECEVPGGAFVYLTYGDNSRPRMQILQSEECVTPQELANDKMVFDGVRQDANGRAIEYYFKTSDTKSRPISADQIVHFMDPVRVGQVRELTPIYPVLDGMLDLRESIDFEFIANKDAALLSKVIKTSSGEVSAAELLRNRQTRSTTNAAGSATTKTRDDFYQEALKGRTLVLRNGDDIAQAANNRPSDAVQRFWQVVSAREGAGLGLPIEILIMQSLQGTMTRAALDIAAGFFRSRAASRVEGFARIREHVLMGNARLRASRPPDWRKYTYAAPRAINVDVGRNSAALIAEWEKGLRTMTAMCAELGTTPGEVYNTRADEWLLARETELKKGVPKGVCLPLQASEITPEQKPAPINGQRLQLYERT